MMRSNFVRGCAAGLALLAAQLAAAPASAVELISNGSFETGDFTGWTQNGGLNQTNVNTGDAVTGLYGARFSPNSLGGISQDIATIAGTTYLFTFDLTKFANPNRVANNFFEVSFNGVVLASLTNSAGFGVTGFSFAPVASGALSSVVFTFRDNWDGPRNRWSLDNVSVSAVGRNNEGVPEPATWAMLLAGFAFVGLAARSRRVARVAA